MDSRRLFIAVVLAVVFMFGVQKLFPPARQPAASHRPTADTLAARPVAPGLATGAAAAAAAPSAATPGTALRGAPADSLAAAPAETIAVSAGIATYQFTSIGAAPVTAELRDYRVLAPGARRGQSVQLARRSVPLLRYLVVAGRDTLPLDRLPFRVTQRPGTAGARTLAFEGALPQGGRATIRYDFASDTMQGYRIRMSGHVDGLPAGRAFLLAQLPEGLRTEEADTSDDINHMAIAYKPVREGAASIPFNKLDAGERRLVTGPESWVVSKTKYFLVGLIAPDANPFAEVSAVGGARTSSLATSVTATAVQPLANGDFGFEIYAGPQQWRRLVAVGHDFESANPYGGWMRGLVQPFATIVMRLLLWMHENFHLAYGWVLVILGIVVRLAMWPLTQRSMRMSLKMQAVQPELQAVQEKYKGNPEELQRQMMRVYKEHNMSPLSGVTGCLPQLLPWPVLATLFFVFQNTIEFRGVPFLWLHDISLRDPYYILPVVMAVSMLLLSWIGTRGLPPNPQTQMMMWMMPAMFLMFFWRVAAGLNLYYAVQNLATLPQQWFLSRERQRAVDAKTRGSGSGGGGPGTVRAPKTPIRPAPATGGRR